MAKAKTKIKNLEYPRPRSFYLCCFGSLPHKTPAGSAITGSEHNLKQKSSSKSWFPWQRIGLRVKNQSTKTVPLEGSVSDEKEKLKLKPKGKANKVHSSKLRSKSNLHNKTQANAPPSSQMPPVLHITPNQTPSESQTSHQQNSENKALEDDTCQHISSSPTIAAATAMSHAVSLPSSKRQVGRLMSSMQQPQTTPKQPRQHQNAKRCNPVVGTSLVMVTLVILILWGRLCAIVCTLAWLYFVPRFSLVDENDAVESPINDSNDLGLDSKVYKKKVVLEGSRVKSPCGVNISPISWNKLIKFTIISKMFNVKLLVDKST